MAKLLLLLTALGSAAAEPPAGGAYVEDFVGKVTVFDRSTGARRRVRRTPQVLGAGDSIRTGAKSVAIVRLGGGSEVRVRPESRVDIVVAGGLGYVLELRYGAVSGTAGMEAGGSLRLKTPAGDCLPEWGSFAVRVRGKKEVGVVSGSGWVEVKPRRAEPVTAFKGDIVWFGPGRIIARTGPAAAQTAAAESRAQPAADPSARRSARADGDDIESLLDRLDRRPGDPDVLEALDSAVMRTYESRERLETRLARPLDDDERWDMVRAALGMKARGIGNAAARRYFMKGHAAFERGQLLIAADQFARCRRLETREDWVGKGLDEYSRRIREGLAALTEERSSYFADAYLAAFESLAKADPQEALRHLRRGLGHLRAFSSAAEAPEVAEEADYLAELVLADSGASGRVLSARLRGERR